VLDFQPLLQEPSNGHNHDILPNMSGWDLDDSQIKVLDIWLSVRPRNESNTIDPSSSSDVLTATDKFIAYLTSQPGAQADEFDDFSNRFANLEHAPYRVLSSASSFYGLGHYSVFSSHK
jgi:hypothetical protein